MKTISGNDIFAKVLSAENLLIQRQNCDTASFNTETRELVLPVFPKEVPDTIEEMFISHEVGHALWTDARRDSEYNKAVRSVNNRAVMRAYLNILEDVRIEKLMKQKYPGLRKTFINGYKDIKENSLFEITQKDPSGFVFIDRINIFFKFGHCIDVPFNDAEREFLPRIYGMNTITDVINMAKELLQFEAQNSQTDQHQDRSEEENADEGEGEEPTSGSGESEQKEENGDSESSSSGNSQEDENTGEEQTEGSDSSDNDEGEGESENAAGAGSGDNGPETDGDGKAGGEEADETETPDGQDNRNPAGHADEAGQGPGVTLGDNARMPETDQSFNKEFERLAQENGSSVDNYYVNEITPGNTIIGYKEFYKKLPTESMKEVSSADSDTKKLVDMLSQEFNMKKAAEQLSRAKQSKTGRLDVKKLYAYKTKKELFKEVTVVPDGKNHGMIMVLDWSGSMEYELSEAVRQVLALVEFCRRVGIPYRVYAAVQAFTHGRDREASKDYNSLHCSIWELFSNEMSFTEHKVAMKVFNRKNLSRVTNYYRLSSTPIGAAVLKISSFVMRDFLNRYNIQKPCFVVLTDGQDNRGFYKSDYTGKEVNSGVGSRHDYNYAMTKHTCVITDKETKVQYNLNEIYGSPCVRGHMTLDFSLQILKDRFDNIPVAVFIIRRTSVRFSARQFNVRSGSFNYEKWYENTARMIKELRTMNSSAVLGSANCFDGLYFVKLRRGDKPVQEELELNTNKKVTPKALSKALTKDVNSNKENRFLLSRFVEIFA